MLNKLMSKLSARINNEEIFAYATGELTKLENVPDEVFSTKMMGEGIAIIPSDGIVVAPADGEIVMIAETKHAFALKTTMGQELLVHMGLETVNLQGEGFEVHVKIGDKVVKGQPVVTMDLEYIAKNSSSTIIPMVNVNNVEGKFIFAWDNVKDVKAGETRLFTTHLK
jgi:PTS system glucose-specific IIA component